jgi:general secretion pathway protein C
MNTAWLEGISPPDKWRTLLITRGPRIATWTLAVLIGVQAALLLTSLAGGTKPKSLTTPTTQNTARSPSVDVAAITNAHLFGAPPIQNPSGDAANAPQTSVPLVLVGIIAADDPESGLAIIGESASASKVYAVGDNLPGGVKLHAVMADRVVIDRGGQLESLLLPRQAQGAQSAPSTGVLQTATPVMDRMRKLISSDPGLLGDIMRPQPVFAQGKQTGYRVYPGRNRQAFSRLGLRPGDLVMAINGTPLDDPMRGQEIFRTLGSSSEAHVTVMRSGQQQDLTLNIAQIAQEAEGLVSSQGEAPGQPPPQPPEAPAQPDGSQ